MVNLGKIINECVRYVMIRLVVYMSNFCFNLIDLRLIYVGLFFLVNY